MRALLTPLIFFISLTANAKSCSEFYKVNLVVNFSKKIISSIYYHGKPFKVCEEIPKTDYHNSKVEIVDSKNKSVIFSKKIFILDGDPLKRKKIRKKKVNLSLNIPAEYKGAKNKRIQIKRMDKILAVGNL